MRFLKLNSVHLPAGRAKYRAYNQESMANAYIAVMEEHLSIRKSAKTYGVPFQTLRDRVAGDVDPECVMMGKQPLFSLEEESRIVNHLKEMAEFGYGYSRKEVIDIATDYAAMLGKKKKEDPALSMNWFYGFLGRWPDLRVVKPRSLEIARAKAANLSNITKYFNELENALVKYGLIDQPHLIYNVDEKGVTINHKPPCVVAGIEKPPQEVTSGRGETVTIIGCGNAIGNSIPPYFIFKGVRMNNKLLDGCTPGTVGTVSPSGWSNSDIFMDWLQNHFSKYVPNNQTALLLLDGHRSHVTLKVIEWAREHRIILQLLPAHSSHILQPLDVGCYGPLQKIYDNLCHKLMRTNSCSITKHDICSLACKAYGTAISTNNLQSAFRKTGLYPFDKDIIQNLPLKPSEVFVCSEVQEVEGEQDMHVVESDREEEEDCEGEKDNTSRKEDCSEGEKENTSRREDCSEGEKENASRKEDCSKGEKENASRKEDCSEGEKENTSRKEDCSKDVNEHEEVDCCVSCVSGKRDVNNFFVSKIAAVKKVKGERKTKKRNVLSSIVGGKTLTEDCIVEKVKDHVNKYSCKKVGTEISRVKGSGRKGCKERDSKKVNSVKVPVQRKRKGGETTKNCKKVKVRSAEDSQEAGPSRIYINEDSELDTENDSEVREEEKCCVCKEFTPEEARKSVSLIFTKWAQCDSCGHWVHLIYCTKVRVLRRGDSFFCVHCKSEDD